MESYKKIKQRDFFLEKGFRPEDTPAFVKKAAIELSLEHFYAPPILVLVELVREFYANFDPDCVGRTVVREVEVDWSPERINKILKLPNISKADFND